jgi:hypothetical protein
MAVSEPRNEETSLAIGDAEPGRLSPADAIAQRRDAEARKRAKADAAPIIAELVAADQPVSWLEDALCRRMGQALAAQDAQLSVKAFEAYTPEQLFDVLVADIAPSAVEDPTEQSSRSRLLTAASRIAPHPKAQPLDEAVVAPTGRALWSRDVYGLRFAIIAPFAVAENAVAADRWYLWDIDVCCDTPFTVGGGYFATVEEAFADWRSAVGPEAAGHSQLEPVSDADLAARFFPAPGDVYYGSPSASQYAETLRSRRLGQELSASPHLGERVHTHSPAEIRAESEVVRKAWVAEFAAWHAENRPGLTVDHDDLSLIWVNVKYPELSYACSPHQMAVVATSVDAVYDPTVAVERRSLFPDIAAWLSERATATGPLPSAAADRIRSYAAGIALPEADLGGIDMDPMARIQE